MQLELVAEAAVKAYLNMVCVATKLTKGFIDISFKTEQEAIEAGKIKLTINNRYVPSCRTRYSHDDNIFVALEDLPCTNVKEGAIKFLHEGFKSYGEVLELELESSPLFPCVSSTKAFALIHPT